MQCLKGTETAETSFFLILFQKFIKRGQDQAMGSKDPVKNMYSRWMNWKVDNREAQRGLRVLLDE